MPLKDTLAMIGVGVISAAATYGGVYFFGPQEAGKSPDFGQLNAVNRVELATQIMNFDCVHRVSNIVTQGVIEYEWNFELAYGVVVPRNHDWNIRREGSLMKVDAPPLTQLRPIQIEFHDFTELDPTSGNRWEEMYYHVLKVAQNWTESTAENRPLIQDDIYSVARNSLQSLILDIASTIEQETPILNVEVSFMDTPTEFKGSLPAFPKHEDYTNKNRCDML